VRRDGTGEKDPLITVASSGGAEMQEGIFSLMQMARVSAAIGRLREGACSLSQSSQTLRSAG